MNSSWLLFDFREPQLELDTSLFQLSFLLFYCCKEQGFCLLFTDLLRELFFYCEVEQVQEDILQYPQRSVIVLSSCSMVQGNCFKIWTIPDIVMPLLTFCILVNFDNRMLGWWSIDEGSRKEQAQLYYAEASGLV